MLQGEQADMMVGKKFSNIYCDQNSIYAKS